jgi:hypothetical protein
MLRAPLELGAEPMDGSECDKTASYGTRYGHGLLPVRNDHQMREHA